jgi:electron transfer flavoprotein alpha subunit
VSTRNTVRVAVVLDGTAADAERQARALGGFLREGLRLGTYAQLDAATHLFHPEEAAGDRLLGLAPTPHVRLVRTPTLQPDLMTAALTAFETQVGAEIYVFPPGPLGAELATRLAVRSGGSVLTDVLSAEAVEDGLACRRSVFSNHLTCRYELRSRPWCLALEAGWRDADDAPPAEHVVETVAGPARVDPLAPGRLEDVELLEPAATGDLEEAAFLVVAGRGAGSRDGVRRIAAAAARMGAAFGVTRPVAMSAWAPADRQLGVSGVRAAPAVCLVAGASGAPAFLWGIERAGFIAAVDTDDRAAIIDEADAVVVDDAVAVVEALADIVAGRRR